MSDSKENNKNEVTENNRALFPPTSGRDMRADYPELNSIKEFNGLESKDLKFIWYFANPTSPVAKKHPKNMRSRAVEAMHLCYGSDIEHTDPKMFRNFRDGVFPNKIIVAIDKMKTFSLSYRSHARLAMEKAFGNMLNIAETDMDNLKEVRERKDYVSTVKDISNTMPKMLSQLEAGFGIRDVVSGEEEDEQSGLMDSVMDNE